MKVNYNFVPEFKSMDIKHKSDIISYAGKLLELVGDQTLIVGVDNMDVPFVYAISARMTNALDFECDTY